MLKKSLIAIAVFCLHISPFLNAVENGPHWDDGYRIFQDHSPNFVQVEIMNVTVTSNKALWFASSSDRVEVEARVLKVIRAKEDLRPGMIIPILYDRKAAAGGTFAETPGIPEKGAVLPAFIKLKGNYFIPAARHHTFTPLAEEQLRLLDRADVELSEAQIAALRLPEDFGNSLQVDTSSELPLEAPEASDMPEVTVTSTELPMVDPETPGMITPTIPQPEASVVVTTETAVPVLKAEVVATPEMPVETAEVTADTSEQPVIDTGSANLAEKPKRRTVVVIPPSQLRAQRAEKIQSVMEQSIPTEISTATEEPVIPVMKAETAVAETPTLSTKVKPEVTEPVVLSSDPVSSVISDTEQTSTVDAPNPVLRAEPVEISVPDTEVTAAATTPTVNIETEPEMPVINPPSSPEPPREEPVTITDFTPEAPAATPTTDPPPSALDLSESDRTNMKSYADIYLSLQEANNAMTEKNYEQAKTLYQKSLQDLQKLKSTFPDFQPFMVEYRIRDTSRKLEQLIMKAPKAEAP